MLASFVMPALAQPGQSVFGAAGVPQTLGQTRDYDRIFEGLKSAGIDLFFPTFLTQEAPTVRTLGFETDFLLPCSPEGGGFKALRRHGIRLIIPGELLYPADAELPAIEKDPLRELIVCAGREGIFGIMSYDEPAHKGNHEGLSKRLFERVKQIDVSVPVLMVHAPIILDQEKHKAPQGRKDYLDDALRQSAHADIVGFDIYPVPPPLAQIGTPFSDGNVADHATAVRDYMEWLRRNLPDKRHLVVLQGFSYRDQFHPLYFKMIGQHVMSIVRSPTLAETREMVKLGIEGGASVVIWWGQSLLPTETAEPWPAILETAKECKTNRPGCE